MANEFIFKFLSVRPADSKQSLKRAPAKTPLYPDGAPKTPLQTILAKAALEGQELVKRDIGVFMKSPRFVSSLDALPFDVISGLKWAQTNRDLLVTDPAVLTGIETVYGKKVGPLVAEKSFKDSLEMLADSIFCLTYTSTASVGGIDKLTAGYKFMLLLINLAEKVTFPSGWTVADSLGMRLIVPPLPGKAPAPVTPPAKPAPPLLIDPSILIRAKLADMETARQELITLANSSSALEPVAGTPPKTGAPKGAAAKPGRTATGATNATVIGASNLVLTPQAVKDLSKVTTAVLTELKFNLKEINPVGAVAAIERQVGFLSKQVTSDQAPQQLLLLGGVQMDKGMVQTSLGISGAQYEPVFLYSNCDFQAGIGDLLMVKQNLIAYELGEFSNVENVLIGETRSREHRRLDTSEDISTTTTETDTTKEQDLESTQRNEMQSEADKTVANQFGLEAGLQVSGSYGPAVSFAAHLNTNFSTSTQEAQKNSVDFSQEITSKTAQSITQKITQSVTHRVLQEIQEINIHSFVNGTGKNIRGVYRWLNKVYNAQVYNYGQRMMYEFVVPEPAAYYIYAMITNPPTDSDLVKPNPPVFNGQPLKPSNLTRWNYFDYVSQYNVAGVPAPPPSFVTASFADKQDMVKDGSDFGRSSTINIPTGYQSTSVTVETDFRFTVGDPYAFHVMVGGHNFDCTNFWGAQSRSVSAQRSEMAVAYLVADCWAFTIGIDVVCSLTDEAFVQWQQSAFDAIIAAYLKEKSDYEEKVAAVKLQNDNNSLGQNPLENARIIKEELKKLVLMMLIGQDRIDKDSYQNTTEPWMDLTETCANGSWIRFFENAFEWTNILYVLYPYFWGRHARWNAAIHFTDPDSDFAAFLRSGAARVQLPVRPGFERALVYFTQTGQVWNGNDPPLQDDDLYVPIIDEIEANLGKFDNDGVVYPDGALPWEVRIPTDLVMLENVDEIPNIIDVMTGKQVTLS